MKPALSRRQMDVLCALADGLTAEETSAVLGISINSVLTHHRYLYRKLRARNAPNAVAIAYRCGLFEVHA